jgi:hypothetical protein
MSRSLRKLMGVVAPLLPLLHGCAEDITVTEGLTGRVEVVFDLEKNLVPTPTDLAKNSKTGLLAVPVADATLHPAQAAFDRYYLNTLDGFPTGATAEVDFAGLLQSSSVSTDAFVVYDVTDSKSPVAVTDVSVTYSEDKTASTSRVLLTRKNGWKRASTYVVFALGSPTLSAASKGLRDSNGSSVIRTATFELVAAENPLCAWDATKSWDSSASECSSPATGKTATGCCTFNYSGSIESLVKSDVRASAEGSGKTDEEVELLVKQTVLDKATSLEPIRSAYDPLFKMLEAKRSDLTREDVVVLWSFSTVSMSEVIYDPTASVIPFPNNILLDPTTKMVAIPASANETSTEKALREGLNTLDGFTTQGSYYAAYSGTVKSSTATLASTSVLVLDLVSDTSPSVDLEVMDNSKTVDESAKAIVITPTKVPLKEKTTYAIVMVSKLKEGDKTAAGGLTDENGYRVVPATFMALLRSKDAVYKDGKSTISSVDDATAKQIETARQAHSLLFSVLEKKGIKREDVVAAWTFTTQSFTEILTKLRALSWSVFATIDGYSPSFTGTLSTDFSAWPTWAPDPTDVGAWIQKGTYESYNALNEQGTAAFYASEADILSKGKEVSVPFTLTIPKTAAPTNGYPVVVFQHGITKDRSDVLYIANALAKKGFAAIAFDAIYHGDRTWCTKDSHCSTGTCTVATGQCETSSGAKDGTLATDSRDVPDASGARFLNTSNPFAVRDNIRQHVIDAGAFFRAINLGAASSITGLSFDISKVNYVGQSLGSILGTLVLATESLPSRAVLSVPGAPLVQIILTSPDYTTTKNALLQGLGIKEGSLDYLKLGTTFTWIIDPADPANFARYVKTDQLVDQVQTTLLGKTTYVTAKEVIIQLAGKDEVIPVELGEYLAGVMDVDTTKSGKSVYANQKHGFLLQEGTTEPEATTAAQTQMTTFLTDGTVCTPVISTGACN